MQIRLRGPIANGRLSKGPRDLLTYRLKAPKPDGTTQLVLSPMTLLERLARLVPAPRLHLTRDFGVLTSAEAGPEPAEGVAEVHRAKTK